MFKLAFHTILVSGLLVSACTTSSPGTVGGSGSDAEVSGADAQTDAGAIDAQARVDANTLEDAATGEDAASAEDAATAGDTGALVDAGGFDATTPDDAGGLDGSVIDAMSPVDAGDAGPALRNECADEVDGCSPNAVCLDLEVGFDCQCRAGFDGDGLSCTDVDECDASSSVCDPNATCTNTPGAYECDCNDGYAGSGRTCTDIDECEVELDNCSVNALCQNSTGGFTCVCVDGYSGDGVFCGDDDECTAGTDNCSPDATCTNSPGAFACECNDGYSGDGVSCMDINECTAGTDNCSSDASCTNLPGAFACDCNDGFSGNGVSCADIDECTLGTDTCSPDATCSNSPGAFACDCNDGYSGDGVSCADIDECTAGTDTCSPDANCLNVAGSYGCICKDGFTGDGRSCTDIDECATGALVCSAAHSTCTNTQGSAECRCDEDYVGDGETCVVHDRRRVSVFANQELYMSATGWVDSATTCAIDEEHRLYCWGNNIGSSTGTGDPYNNYPVQRPTEIGAGLDWVMVEGGGKLGCAIERTGALWCWGRSYWNDLLGRSSWGSGETGYAAPTQFGYDAWKDIALTQSTNTACAIQLDGSLWCWGEDRYGKRGVGTSSFDRIATPARVGSDSNWAEVEAGWNHFCARQSDGDVFCWGKNDAGQLANGTTTGEATTPVRVAGTYSHVSAGAYTSCAIGSDNLLYCWGYFIGGSYRTAPTAVGTHTDWIDSDSSYAGSCGIRADGSRWCWANDRTLTFGTSSLTSAVPVKLSVDGEMWSEISLGWGSGCGMQGDALYCWGQNDYYQVGDGTTTDRTSPVMIW